MKIGRPASPSSIDEDPATPEIHHPPGRAISRMTWSLTPSGFDADCPVAFIALPF
jgi:hypothetical protein